MEHAGEREVHVGTKKDKILGDLGKTHVLFEIIAEPSPYGSLVTIPGGYGEICLVVFKKIII